MHNVSELPVVPKIRAVKVEKMKKSPFTYGNRRFFRFFKWAWKIAKVLSHRLASMFILILIRPFKEVHNVSELPVVLKIPAVKVEQSKKTSVLVLNQMFFSIGWYF